MKNNTPGILSPGAASPPGILSTGAANPSGVLSQPPQNLHTPVFLALNQIGTRPNLDPALRKHLSEAVERLGATTSPMDIQLIQLDALKGVPRDQSSFARRLFGELTTSLAAQQASNGQ